MSFYALFVGGSIAPPYYYRKPLGSYQRKGQMADSEALDRQCYGMLTCLPIKRDDTVDGLSIKSAANTLAIWYYSSIIILFAMTRTELINKCLYIYIYCVYIYIYISLWHRWLSRNDIH